MKGYQEGMTENRNKRKIGSEQETAARIFLEGRGVHILEKNYRCRQGEIDLIGLDGEYLVFFEIKYRKNEKAGHPAEAVNWHKQRNICRVSDYYRYMKNYAADCAVRYDVVAVMPEQICWYKNAFDYIT